MENLRDFGNLYPVRAKKVQEDNRKPYQSGIRLNTIKIFCLDSCEHSNHLKQALWDNNIEFEEVYLGSARAIHDLRNGGLQHATAPVLQVKELFYMGSDLFPGGIMDGPFIEQCLGKPDPIVSTGEKNEDYHASKLNEGAA